ncbi:MAG: hypothetical protein IRZ00_13240 [Gemmatimonadetes bacterium]|nr:hypothetical protein [Gemmatimonadota bacterium]
MPDYRVFGRCLRSALPLPELAPVAGAGPPDWTLRVTRRPVPAAVGELWGEYRLGDAFLRLHAAPDGLRLVHSGTGCYTIAPDGSDIVWHAVPGASRGLARAAVMGPVLAAALHLRGVHCLHGSAVALGAEGLAFLAPKGFGKSTLAAALVRAGARLLSDDTVAVELGADGIVWPGGQRVRLWRDAARRLADRSVRPVPVATGKYEVTCAGPARAEGVRLAAIYVLEPVGGAADVARHRLPASAALVALLRHAKLAHLLGVCESRTLLDRSLALARRVPVYELALPRGYGRLADVVARLAAWHPAAEALVPGVGE